MNSLLLAAVLAGVPSDSQPSLGGRVAAGVSLLAAGSVVSIVNTTAAYATCEAYLSCASWAEVSPIGIGVSTLPLLGPAVGIVSDLAMWSEARANLPTQPGRDIAFRTAVNAVSLAMQVTGLVLLLTMPRQQKAPRFAVTGFGAAPVSGGASVGLGGTFDFPY